MTNDQVFDTPGPGMPSLSRGGIGIVAAYHVVLFILLAYLLIALWPLTPTASTSLKNTAFSSGNAAQMPGSQTGDNLGNTPSSGKDVPGTAQNGTASPKTPVQIFWRINLDLTQDMQMLLLVMVTGAFGSLIPAATSLAVRVANHTMSASWVLWYLIHPLIAMALATVVYLAVRGGFLNPNPTAGQVNVYATAALAGLVGWFSKQATAKMEEVFESLFKTALPRAALMQLTRVTPSTVTAGSGTVAITLIGTNFTRDCIVRLDGSDQPTTFVSTTQITAQIPASKTTAPGLIKVTLYCPVPNANESAPVTVEVK